MTDDQLAALTEMRTYLAAKQRREKQRTTTIANANARWDAKEAAALRALSPAAARLLAAMTPAEPSGDIAPEAPSSGSTTAEEPGRDLPAWATAEPEGDPPIVVERGERKTGARRQ